MSPLRTLTTLRIAAAALAVVALPAMAITALDTDIAASVQAGENHSCAVLATGGAKCWGRNTNGQLGRNSTTTSLNTFPRDVTGLTSGVVAIAVGGLHTCALTTAGGVKCWGANAAGQVGDGSNTQRLAPVNVSGLTSGVAAIVAGDLHSCALLANGGVKCWGTNASGQYGNNSTTSGTTPVAVQGLGGRAIALASGWDHVCAIMESGAVKCWGRNANGQLGDGSTTQQNLPVAVSGLASVVAITAGRNHTCARTSAGAALCWGDNTLGQIGDSSNAERHQPVAVTGLGSGVAAISAGQNHTCAVTTAGAAKCWGWNANGPLGDDTIVDKNAPVDVVSLDANVSAISAGGAHTCALTHVGTQCWGWSGYGQIGDGANLAGGERHFPDVVVGESIGAVAVAAGHYQACALTTGGAAKCWGNLLATGPGPASSATALTIDTLDHGVASIQHGLGDEQACAIMDDGTFWCWGTIIGTNDGQTPPHTVFVDVLNCGFTNANVCVEPGQIFPPPAASSLAVGEHFICYVTLAGGVKCWGLNDFGQLGNGCTVGAPATDPNWCPTPDYSVLTPVDVVGLSSGVVAVTAGQRMACALTSGGAVKCWGEGFLGDGVHTQSSTPVDVTGLGSGVQAIVAGYLNTCALLATGGLKCWGLNQHGEVGNGNTTQNVNTPTDVVGLGSGVAAVALGVSHSCARMTGGTIKCWGENEGAFGDGCVSGVNCVGSSSPVDVPGITNASAVTAGDQLTCALLPDKTAKCWGFPNNSITPLGRTSGVGSVPGDVFATFQSIAWPATPTSLLPGAGTSLSASATSGLGVVFDTWTPSICSITGNTLTAIAPGTCGVRATQAGDATYSLAPTQTRFIAVTVKAAIRDLDADGKSDLIWRNAADGSVQAWLMNGLATTSIAGLLPAGGGYTVTHVADLNGDGYNDLLIRNTDGTVIAWLMNGLSVIGQTTLAPAGSGYTIVKVGDLNGDGMADILWQAPDGSIQAWLMNGLTPASIATFVGAGSGWTPSQVADFDGDGKADILWQNTDGSVQLWLMNGLSVTGVASLAPAGSGWSPVLTGDFDGDGKADLMWQHTNGATQTWLMNGLSVTSLASFTPAASGWTPVLAGDIDGDGKDDLFWQHTSGASQTWLMNGLSVANVASFVSAGNWSASHLLDLDGDGKRDILWKNTDGSVQAWLMNGLTVTSIASLAPPGTYVVIPPMP